MTCFQEKAALLAELEALRNEGKRTEELQKLMASLEQDAWEKKRLLKEAVKSLRNLEEQLQADKSARMRPLLLI